MGIITKGMGAIMKGAKKRKTLTISVPKKSTDVNPFKQKRRNIHGWKRKVKWPTKKDKDRFSEAVKREVIIKKKSKPSKTKLADTWQGRRIDAINRKIKPSRGGTAPDYAQEASDIYSSKASTKKSYKANQKKFYSLPEKERNKIWKIKSRRELKGK